MVGRLIVGLVWLTFVKSDILENVSMNEAADKMSMTMPLAAEHSSSLMPVKSKRYLSHSHSSPCPPFYPNFGMHMPMHAMRPYGPPAYPKNDIVPAMYHQPQHNLHYVHQPPYTSYVPKQTIQYIKPEVKAPAYHPPIVAPPIHPVVKLPSPPLNYYHHYQPPMLEHKIAYEKQPIFSYAPAYHKPMPMIWPATQIKKYDLPINHVSYDYQPAIVHKPEPPKCAPCPPPQHVQPIHQPQHSSIVKIAPVHPVQHAPPMLYLPAPVHQPIVKPCD